MLLQRKIISFLFCIIGSLLLPGCSTLDDYMLGKDNTPSPEALTPLDSKVQIKETWSVPAGTNKKNTGYLKLKPVLKDNNVYTADAGGIVQAVNAKDGRVVWSKALKESILSGPIVAQNHLIISTDASHIMALNPANGEMLWQSNVSSDVLSKPVIAGNKVIAKTIDGNLYAFDLSSGRQQWLAVHGAPNLILKASSSPVILDNRIVLAGYSDGKMDAVDLQTGQILWQRSIAYASGASDVERLVDIDADPVVQGKTAFLAAYQGYVGAMSLVDGQFVWRKPASSYTNIAVNGNTLFMTDSDDTVWAINKTNGQVNWKQTALKARGLTEPVLLGQYVVVGDKTGMLHVLSAHNGEFLARTQLGGAITTAPAAVGKAIYVMTANGRLNRYSVS